MKIHLTMLFIFFLLNFVTNSFGFYLPGIAPVTYCLPNTDIDGCVSDIAVYVNKLDSSQSVLPYEYSKFDFCVPKVLKSPTENLGQILFGERIQNSPYKIEFGKRLKYQVVCIKRYNPSNVDDGNKLKFLMHGIANNYKHHWIVDNLPVVSCYKSGGNEVCYNGFSVGCYQDAKSKTPICTNDMNLNKPNTYFLFNHVTLTIGIYSEEKLENPASGRIVFVRIDTTSKAFVKEDASEKDLDGAPPLILNPDKINNIRYTYSVKFEVTDEIKWSSRWDYVLKTMPQSNIQWFSILNSVIIVLFLSGMLAMILLKTLHRDIDRYNKLDTEEAQEEFGWKLVHGDVFRPPKMGMTLCVFVGSGIQLILMTIITLFISCFGFLSPANRGAFVTCGIVFYVLFGAFAGYFSARLYKMMSGEKWKSNVLLTAFLCPGSVFGIFFILNIVLWASGSSAAVPFTTILGLLAMWFLISVPLCFVGAYFGFKKPPMSQPVRTNQIPRQVPYQYFYTRSVPSILMGGVLPFGCIFIQLFFILNSIWSTYVYYMFGLLFLVFMILVITCSETTILLCYFHLCAEDYRWWWRSFLTSGCTALYLLGYSIYFFHAKLDIKGSTSTFLYFGYTAIIIWLAFLLTGTVGFITSFWFVRKIYSVVKVD